MINQNPPSQNRLMSSCSPPFLLSCLPTVTHWCGGWCSCLEPHYCTVIMRFNPFSLLPMDAAGREGCEGCDCPYLAQSPSRQGCVDTHATRTRLPKAHTGHKHEFEAQTQGTGMRCARRLSKQMFEIKSNKQIYILLSERGRVGQLAKWQRGDAAGVWFCALFECLPVEREDTEYGHPKCTFCVGMEDIWCRNKHRRKSERKRECMFVCVWESVCGKGIKCYPNIIWVWNKQSSSALDARCNRTPTQFASVSIAIARVPGVSDNASHQNRFGIAGVGAGHENRSSFVAVANHSRLVPHAFSVGRLAARGRGLVVFLLVAFIWHNPRSVGRLR